MSMSGFDLPRIELGRTGLLVSRLGFGCSTIASLNTRYTPAEVRATLHAAVDAGINFFDTADIYGQGDSERLLGRLRRERGGQGDALVLATKVGLDLAWSQHVVRRLKPLAQPLLRRWSAGRQQAVHVRHAVQRHCADVAELRRRVQASLRRLGGSRIDLLLLHSPPASWVQRDELRRLLQDLMDDGSVRTCGVSVQQVAEATDWLAWSELDCMQLPLTPPLAPDTHGALDALRDQGIGVVAREVFGGGRLADGGGSREHALAAVLSAPAVHTVLVGMGCRAHLADNLAQARRALYPAATGGATTQARTA